MTLFSFIASSLIGYASTNFTDQDFNQLTKGLNGGTALIYTWSPNMALSQQGLDELLKLETGKSKRLIVLLDPNANRDLAAKIAADHKWPASTLTKNNSTRLYKAGGRIHYPSYFLVKDGSLKSFIPGYKSPDHLQKLLKYTK